MTGQKVSEIQKSGEENEHTLRVIISTQRNGENPSDKHRRYMFIGCTGHGFLFQISFYF